MKKILFFSLLLISFIGCQKIRPTHEDEIAIQKILNFYGGNIEIRKIFGSNNVKTFEIQIKNTKLIDSQPEKAVTHCGNIAYLFFKNNSNFNYDVVKTKIIFPDGTDISKEFSRKDLVEVEKFYPTIDNLNSFLINNNYSELLKLFDEKYRPDENTIREGLTKFNNDFGNIKSIQFQGFNFINDPTLGNIIFIREVCQRESKILNMNVGFNRDTKKLVTIEFP